MILDTDASEILDIPKMTSNSRPARRVSAKLEADGKPWCGVQGEGVGLFSSGGGFRIATCGHNQSGLAKASPLFQMLAFL